jgi:hypothetical protein
MTASRPRKPSKSNKADALKFFKHAKIYLAKTLLHLLVIDLYHKILVSRLMTHNSRLVLKFSLLALSTVSLPVMVQAQSTASGMANREIARRYARIEDAQG